MKLINKKRGVGLIAVIFIVVIITVGGVVAVQISKKAQLQTDVQQGAMIDVTQEKITAVKRDAQTALIQLKSQIGISENIDEVRDVVAEIKADLGAAYVDADAAAKAEFAAIMTRLDKLEADVAAGANSVSASLDATIETIGVSLSEELFVDDATSEMNTENDTDVAATSSSDGTDVAAATETDTTITVDDMDITSELETTSTVTVE